MNRVCSQLDEFNNRFDELKRVLVKSEDKHVHSFACYMISLELEVEKEDESINIMKRKKIQNGGK